MLKPHPSHVVPPPEGEVELSGGDGQRAGTLFLAIAIVVTTVAAALVELAHAYDGHRADAATSAAHRLAADSVGTAQAAQQGASVLFEAFAQAEQQRTAQATDRQWWLIGIPGLGARSTLLDEARQGQLAATSDANADALKAAAAIAASAVAPDQDPNFPDRLFQQASRPTDEAWAIQDAALEEALAWHSRVGQLTAVLTLFAIAAYLFGLGLAVRLRINRILAGVAAVLLVAGIGWSIALQLSPPQRAPDQAAHEFAEARWIYHTAQTDADYQAAYQHLTRAIELRPRFAQAYADRGSVAFAMGSPERAGRTDISSIEGIHRAVADDQKAYDLGLQTKDVLTNLGYEQFLLGLLENRPDLYPKSIDSAIRAEALDPLDPIDYYNEGLPLLASGQFTRATSVYTDAAVRTAYLDAGHTLRNDYGFEESNVAGAFTDLEVLSKHQPELGARIASIKEIIVQRALEHWTTAGRTIAVTNPDLLVLPSLVLWKADLPGYDPQRDAIAVQWYYQDPQARGWVVLPGVSGRVEPTPDPDAAAGNYYATGNYLAQQGECLADGSYRAEIYVNGHLALSKDTTLAVGGMTAAKTSELGAGFCRPASWIRGVRDRGLSDGYVKADHSAGVYVFRYMHPGPQPNPALLTNADLQRAVDQFKDRLPIGLTYEVAYDGGQRPGLSARSGAVYGYQGGRALVTSGFAADGATVVMVVFGPTDYINKEQQPLQIVGSLFGIS